MFGSDWLFFFFQAEDGIRDDLVTGVQTCALPISGSARGSPSTAPIAREHSSCNPPPARGPVRVTSQMARVCSLGNILDGAIRGLLSLVKIDPWPAVSCTERGHGVMPPEPAAGWRVFRPASVPAAPRRSARGCIGFPRPGGRP